MRDSPWRLAVQSRVEPWDLAAPVSSSPVPYLPSPQHAFPPRLALPPPLRACCCYSPSGASSTPPISSPGVWRRQGFGQIQPVVALQRELLLVLLRSASREGAACCARARESAAGGGRDQGVRRRWWTEPGRSRSDDHGLPQYSCSGMLPRHVVDQVLIASPLLLPPLAYLFPQLNQLS